MKAKKRPGETLAEKQARLKEEAVLQAEQFYHYDLIARATGMTDDTLKKYRDEDPDFSERLEKSRTQFLHKNLRRAKPEFLLERLEPRYFKETKELNITVPRPILGGATKNGEIEGTD